MKLVKIAIACNLFVIAAFAQYSRPITVTFGEPNVWSYEQARELLTHKDTSGIAPYGNEAGSGQRLVYLDLPHSLYVVPERCKHQLIQVWWRVKGYYEGAASGGAAAAPRPLGALIAIDSDANWPVRAVDVVPGRSSLNVADRYELERNWNLGGRLAGFFGSGNDTRLERQRKRYSQYVSQDMLASGFGEGSRDFGWTFGPNPGTESVAPGIKTTHAMLIVPEKARAVRLSALACYFPNDVEPPRNYADVESFLEVQRQNLIPERDVHCSDPREIDVLMPDVPNNTFSIQSVEYQSTMAGQRSTVIMHGSFSPRVSVLVDGIALAHGSTGRPVTSNTIAGDYDILSPQLLVASFRVPPNYQGTPKITVSAPGRAETIADASLQTHGPMFVGALSIEGAHLQRAIERGAPKILLDVTGRGFLSTVQISINGRPLAAPQRFSSTELILPLSADDLLALRNVDDVNIYLKQSAADVLDQGSFTFKNTTIPRGAVSQIKYRDLSSKKEKRDEILITVEGSNFGPDTVAELSGRPAPVLLVSPTKLMVHLIGEGELDELVILRLKDSISGSESYMPVTDFREQAHPKPAPKPPPRPMSLPS